MRLLPLVLVLACAVDARAATLQVDEVLLYEVARIVDDPLPIVLAQADDPEDDEERTERRRRRRDDDGGSSASSGGGGGGAYSPMGRPFGIGLQLGFPTALTLKYFVVGDQAIQGGIGVGSGWIFDPGLSIHVDYVWHPTILASTSAFNLSWYVGGGGWLSLFAYHPWRGPYVPGLHWYGLPSYLWLGARVPIGVNLALREVPFEVFLEAAPALLLFPYVTFGIGFSIGARFYI